MEELDAFDPEFEGREYEPRMIISMTHLMMKQTRN
jgi:hypothetical protein